MNRFQVNKLVFQKTWVIHCKISQNESKFPAIPPNISFFFKTYHSYVKAMMIHSQISSLPSFEKSKHLFKTFSKSSLSLLGRSTQYPYSSSKPLVFIHTKKIFTTTGKNPKNLFQATRARHFSRDKKWIYTLAGIATATGAGVLFYNHNQKEKAAVIATQNATKIPKYGPLYDNKTLVLHGVGCKVWKIASILNHGILSFQAAKDKKLVLGLNYGHEGLPLMNGIDYISVAHPPTVRNDSHEAFSTFIKNGASLAIVNVLVTTNAPVNLRTCNKKLYNSLHPGNRELAKEMGYGYFECSDEAYVYYQIEPKCFVGLVIDERLMSKKITEIEWLSPHDSDHFQVQCLSFLHFLKENYNIEDESLAEKITKPALHSFSERLELINECRNLFYLGLSKRHASWEEITVIDLLITWLPERMKIYNTDGFEICP